MFDIQDTVDYFVAPVNCVGNLSGGLLNEFKTRCPSYVEPYQEACKTNELRVGTLNVIEDTGQRWGIISLPVKRHYADSTHSDDIARSLEALQNLLKSEKYRYSVVCIPMMGAIDKSYHETYQILIDHLSDMEATVLLCMSPERTERRPKYLTIVGCDNYSLSDPEKIDIDNKINKIMEIWGTKLTDYESILSGGHKGVDEYIGGLKFKSTDTNYIFNHTGKIPLIIKPNDVRNGSASNLLQGDLLCEVSHDIILIKPKMQNNNRLIAMQLKINEINKLREHVRDSKGVPKKRLAVIGEISTKLYDNNILVPVVGGHDD
jgi:hypothetical protein